MELLLHRLYNTCSTRTFFKEIPKGNISFHKNSIRTDIVLNETPKFEENIFENGSLFIYFDPCLLISPYVNVSLIDESIFLFLGRF